MKQALMTKSSISFLPRIFLPAFLFLTAVLPANAAQQLKGHLKSEWAKMPARGRVKSDRTVGVAIGLPLRNQEALQYLLKSLYDPKSHNYHHFLTPEKFAQMFGPSEADYQAVIQFAKAHGLKVGRELSSRQVVFANGKAQDIERAFNVHLETHQRADGTEFFAPDVEPSVDLNVPILHVSGLDNFTPPQPHYRIRKKLPPAEAPAYLDSIKAKWSRVTPKVGGAVNSNFPFTGQDFRQAYVPCTPLTGDHQSVGLFELDSFFPNDITTYENAFSTPSWSPNVPVLPLPVDDTSWFLGFNVCGTPFDPGQVVEVTLDVQMAIAMAPRLNEAYPGSSQAYGVVVYEGVQIPNYYYTSEDWILAQMAAPPIGVPLSKQLSSSWSISRTATTDSIFAAFAAQGQSFFQAAGDDGSYQSGSFPTSNLADIGVGEPYMTVVGGTSLFTDPSGNWSNEVVWNNTQCFLTDWTPTPGVTPSVKAIGSGGVYTDPTPIPTYQYPFINFSNNGDPNRRNLPDISMVADNILTVADNYPAGMTDWTYWFWTGNVVNTGYVVGAGGGTSYAAPLWAGFTALVNQQAQANNLAPIGFINPALYDIAFNPSNYANDYNDVTSGNNATNGTDGSCSPALSTTNGTNGYPAVAGYDLSTGLGSPKCALINALVPYAPTFTPTFTNTPTLTATITSTYTPTNSLTNTPTNTKTLSPTNTATNTRTNTNTLTATNTRTNTKTLTPTNTRTNTRTLTPTKTPTKGSPTNTPTNTRTNTFTRTFTNTNTRTFTNTATNTRTLTFTNSPTNTRTLSPTNTATNTRTGTFTNTPTVTLTWTFTNSPTLTATPTYTDTATFTPRDTWTPTPILGVCGPGQPGSSWNQLTVSGSLPSGLGLLAFNPNDGNGDRLFVLPGGGSNQVWSSTDGTSWNPNAIVAGNMFEDITGLQNLTAYQSASFEDLAWVVGGLLSGSPVNTVWRSWDAIHWDQWATPPFSARWGHSMACFGKDVNMYVIGGATGATGPVLNDVWFTSDGQHWAQSTPTIPGQVFPARAQHSSVVFNGQMYVLGGLTTPGTSATALNDVWYTPNGKDWYPSLPSYSGQIFTPRYNAQAVVCGNALWVIGGTGTNGSALHDTWVSQDGANWTQVNTSNPFTGAYCASYHGDVWAVQSGVGVWNTGCCQVPTPTPTTDPTPTNTPPACLAGQPGNSWTQMGTLPPSVITGMTAFDPGSGPLMWQFGAYTVMGAPTGGVWYSNGGAWAQASQNYSQTSLFAATSSTRGDEGIAVFKGKIFVIGGQISGGTQSDIWYSSDAVNWTKSTTPAAFGRRADFGLVVYNNKLWLIGGASTLTPNDAKNDVWSSDDGVVWKQVTSSAAFSPRYRLGALVFNGAMYVLGGDAAFTYPPACNSNAAFNDVWTSTDGATWTPVTANAAFPAGAGLDSVVCGNAMWVMTTGGVWVSTDGASWTQTNTTAPLGNSYPKPISYNQSVWIGGNTVSNSGCCQLPTPTPTIDPTPTPTLAVCASGQPGNSWSSVATGVAPANMNGMTAFDVGNGPMMWLFGTYTVMGGPVGGVWYSSDGSSWTQAPQNASQSTVFANNNTAGRNHEGIVVFNGKIYVIGGYSSGGSVLSDVWNSSDGVTWNQVTSSPVFGHRTDFGLVVYNNKMWLIGGASTLTPNDAKNDVWYTTDGVNWCQATASAAFTPRTGLGAVVLNNQIYVLGGQAAYTYPPACNSNGAFGDVWTSTDGVNWTQVTPSAAFPAGAGYNSVVCGNAMWVLSGNGVWVSTNGSNWIQTNYATAFNAAGAPKPISFNNGVWMERPVGSNWVWNSACCQVPTPTPTIDPTPTATLAVCATGQPGNSWTQTGTLPPSVITGLTAFDAGNGPLLWQFGSYTVMGAPTGGVWYSSTGSAWTQAPQNSSQTSLFAATSSTRGDYGTAVFNGKIFVIGGQISGGTQSDIWYSSDAVNWNKVTTSVGFGRRSDFGLVVYNNKLWLIGGASTLTPNDAKNDVWCSSDGISWCQVTAAAAFPARFRLGAVVLNNQMYILGGTGPFVPPPGNMTYYNDVWTSTDGATWTQVTGAAGFPVGNGTDSVVCGNAIWLMTSAGVWVSQDGSHWTQTNTTAPLGNSYPQPISYNQDVWIGGSVVSQSACCLLPTPTPGGNAARTDRKSALGLTPTPTPTSSPTPQATPTADPAPEAPGVTVAPNVSRSGQPIQFEVTLGQASSLSLTLYTVSGEPIYQARSEGQEGGNSLVWDGRNNRGEAVASGLYIYVLQYDDGQAPKSKVGKVVVLR
ncbi:MAG TPA: protease pro-enzyme activation domain-containing protein [bacterium]|nr:protease pro-enzyme activation domain-containing protein [bacterium]